MTPQRRQVALASRVSLERRCLFHPLLVSYWKQQVEFISVQRLGRRRTQRNRPKPNGYGACVRACVRAYVYARVLECARARVFLVPVKQSRPNAIIVIQRGTLGHVLRETKSCYSLCLERIQGSHGVRRPPPPPPPPPPQYSGAGSETPHIMP